MGDNDAMSSNQRFLILLLAIGGLCVVMAVASLRTERRFAEIETLQRAPTAPPLRELDADLRQVATGRRVYVPVYSHIYAEGGREYPLETTLSIRNADVDHSLVVDSIRYYDNEGRLLREYLDRPIVLGPLASTDFLVERRDVAGGVGANFLVDWMAEEAVTEPLIEAVMAMVGGDQAMAFRSPGYAISRFGVEDDR